VSLYQYKVGVCAAIMANPLNPHASNERKQSNVISLIISKVDHDSWNLKPCLT